jgi:exosortase/archaeosortase family protein
MRYNIFGKFTEDQTGSHRIIASFFIKLALLTTVWFVLYWGLLSPLKTIDKPLTSIITRSVAFTLNTISSEKITWIEVPEINKNYLLKNGKRSVQIAYSCNGIDLIFIYVSVIVLLPYSSKRKIVFSLVGVVLLTIANIFRICLLYYLFEYQYIYFEFSHHYLFTILMYIFIFYGWIKFIDKRTINEKSV